jgi:hypothetical protein
MRRHRKMLLVGLVLLGLLGVWWHLSVSALPQSPPIRLAFVCFTNDSSTAPMAVFSLSNSTHRSILFAAGVMVPTDGSRPPMYFPPDRQAYMSWAGNPPERPASALPAGTLTMFATKLPEPGSVWIERVIWQLKPTTLQHGYATALDKTLSFFHRNTYPPGMRPAARIWQEVSVGSGMLPKNYAEPGAAPNAAPPHR